MKSAFDSLKNAIQFPISWWLLFGGFMGAAVQSGFNADWPITVALWSLAVPCLLCAIKFQIKEDHERNRILKATMDATKTLSYYVTKPGECPASLAIERVTTLLGFK